jgi:hypothetical protein
MCGPFDFKAHAKQARIGPDFMQPKIGEVSAYSRPLQGEMALAEPTWQQPVLHRLSPCFPDSFL